MRSENVDNLHWELSLPLKEGSVGLHESVRLNVLDGNTTHFVGIAGDTEGLVEREVLKVLSKASSVVGRGCAW